jgi:hypothetical protein
MKNLKSRLSNNEVIESVKIESGNEIMTRIYASDKKVCVSILTYDLSTKTSEEPTIWAFKNVNDAIAKFNDLTSEKVEVTKPATFTNSIIEGVMLSFINKGVKINSIRAKMRRFASQSQLCKMYHKLIAQSKIITVMKHCNGLVSVIKSNHHAVKCGGLFQFRLDELVNKYNLKVVVL